MAPLLGLFPFLASVNNPNENVRTYMTMALVEHHTLRLDPVVERFGWTNDMALVPAPEGAYRVSVKGPAVSLAGVLPYAAFAAVAPRLGLSYPEAGAPREEAVAYLRAATWACRLFAVQLPCFLFLVWLERYLRAFSGDVSLRLSAVAAAGLGTNYIAYANMFASHALFAVAAFTAFALTERALREGRAVRLRVALIAGWFTGLSVLLEYHALPLALVLALYGLVAFRRPATLAAFAAGGLFHVAAMMLFQWAAYGNPLTPGHRMVESGLRAHHQAGLFGATAPDLAHVRALWFDAGFGFFGTSPFMWLGLLALPLAIVMPAGTAPRRRLSRLAVVVAALGLFALSAGASGFGNWRGGWTVGPRFLGAAPPFVALGALVVAERFAGRSERRRALARGAAGGLALASVLSIGLVAIVYNSLPEEIERPLTQFAIPLIRTGFLPHHVGEWAGWSGPAPWYFACAGLLAAPIYAAVVVDRERRWAATMARFGAAACALALGLAPALSAPPSGAPRAHHPALRSFVTSWEPKGQDRITKLREQAERFGPRRPCTWHRLADLDRIVGLEAEARADERRARAPRPADCSRRIF